MTDFRALCADLYAAFNTYAVDESHYDLLRRARAALAESQPAADGEVSATGKPGLQDGPAVQSREPASVTTEPSDQQLMELMPETMRDEFSYAARICSNAMAGRVKPGIFRVALNTAALEFARAVLARWGTPNLAETRSSLEPIPVSERLPEAGDCDAEGRCWAHQPHEACPESPSWELLLAKYVASNYGTACWLPFNALPLPKEVE
jgi:hypothetical protein